MNKNKSHVVLVLDRSGSMQSCKTDTEGGVNSFIEEQAKPEGEVTISIVQFDNVYEYVCKNIQISEVKPYKLVPRGSTALLDAVGMAVVETGEYLAGLEESDRPGLVTIMIVTDGLENSSKEYTNESVKKLIEEQQEKYNWQFSYLGANQDAFKVGGLMGLKAGDIGNYSEENTSGAIRAMSGKFGRMRSAVATSTSEADAVVQISAVSSYTDEERKDMEDKNVS